MGAAGQPSVGEPAAKPFVEQVDARIMQAGQDAAARVVLDEAWREVRRIKRYADRAEKRYGRRRPYRHRQEMQVVFDDMLALTRRVKHAGLDPVLLEDMARRVEARELSR